MNSEDSEMDVMTARVTHPGNSEIGMGASPRVNSTCTYMCL